MNQSTREVPRTMERWVERTISVPVFLCSLVQLIPASLYAGQCVFQVRMVNHNRYVYKTEQECGIFHSSPWGNWGVSSNVGVKEDRNQFRGWYPQDGHLQWNSCSTGYLHPDLDCRALNFPNSPLPGTHIRHIRRTDIRSLIPILKPLRAPPWRRSLAVWTNIFSLWSRCLRSKKNQSDGSGPSRFQQ
jgi:hypothetical protein